MLALLPLFAASGDAAVAAITKRAATACGITLDGAGWELTGTVRSNGINDRYRFVCDGGARYVEIDTGPLNLSNGFDGRAAWTSGPSGVPHSDILETRDEARLVSWVADGEWCNSLAPLRMKLIGPNQLSLVPTDGLIPATLKLTPETGLPKSLTLKTLEGTRVVTYSAYRAFGKRVFPTRVVSSGPGDPSDQRIIAAKAFKASSSLFQPPSPDDHQATFDLRAGRRVPIKRVLGYTFVHPSVNGKDVGWFLLDSGAGGFALDSAAAAECKVQVLGKTRVTGISATTEANIVRGAAFRLGPLTIIDPVFGSLDLRQFMRMFPLKIGGICGYDLLARCDLELDPYATTATMTPPGGGALPSGATWSTFEFFSGIMCMRCKYQGEHDGWFLLDTGSGDALDFTSTAVKTYGLLKGRQTTSVRAEGIGGGEDFESGALGWFQLGTQRLTDVSAGFHTTQKGMFASPYLAGNIGNQILGLFHTVIDYRNKRISLSWPK